MMTMHSAAATMIDCGNNHHIQVAASAAAFAPPTSAPVAWSEFWTTSEVAAYLRCEPQTIRKNLSSTGAHHGLKPRRFGRRWYFSAAEVRATLSAEV
ncbi:helix-turn-helix domain-containing protein (plasmid) [Paraburkholderia strydomiana]